MLESAVRAKLAFGGWFSGYGAYVLVDGQYGSTGKGLVAGAMAEMFANEVDVAVTNAGPNSGHTSYYNGEKIVLKQLPTFGVVAQKMGYELPIYINAGAIVDKDILKKEVAQHHVPKSLIMVHRNAAVVTNDAKSADKSNIHTIGSTAQGTGPAMIGKIQRNLLNVVAGHFEDLGERMELVGGIDEPRYIAHDETVFIEVSQGYSLGIDQPFYPFTTSRNCTVMQALSDAEIHPRHYRQCTMVVRTFPIRVGGNSGPCYPDQHEMSWNELGVPAEYTTVTNRERRVFNFSRLQFIDAVAANRPDHVVLNFCNYLDPSEVSNFVAVNILEPYFLVTGTQPKTVILGFGPEAKDLRVFE